MQIFSGGFIMVEHKQVWNEGSLARDWEQRLKPRVEPRRRRRVLAPWFRTAAWIAGLWVAAMVPALLAVHVLTMSFKYDQANQQYAALVRQNQMLAATVAKKSSPTALSRDAARLKVAMVQPRVESVKAPAPVHSSHTFSAVERVTHWINQLSLTLGQ